MQVQGSSAQASVMALYRAQQAQQAAAVLPEAVQAEKQGQATSAPRAANGSGSPKLAAGTMGYAIQASQEVTAAEETPWSKLPAAAREDLEAIARDPAYAAQKAEELGTQRDGFFFSAEEFPPNGSPAEAWQAFGKRMEGLMAQTEQVQQERSAYYAQLKGQGMPPAEMYEKLLEFNAGQSEAYSALVGNESTAPDPNYSWTERNAASAAYLRDVMDQQGLG